MGFEEKRCEELDATNGKLISHFPKCDFYQNCCYQGRFFVEKQESSALTVKTVCPSGLRGWTQVPLARAAWVQIPQLSTFRKVCQWFLHNKSVFCSYTQISGECIIGPVAQWIRHRPTEPGIAGSSPAGVKHLSGDMCFCLDHCDSM